MNKDLLNVTEETEEVTITSQEVSEMVGRRHDQVMRDVNTIIKHLGDHKSVESYFIESTYVNSQNKVMPRYMLTKKGCELYATRMTGAKGTLFAVQYIEKFNELQDDNKRLATDNKDLHAIATDEELDEQQRKYEADKKRYSWHNIRTVLENSDYKTIEDEVEAIINFHTNELKKKDRANYPAHKEANKTEYKQIVRDRVFAVLDEITNKTLDGVLRAVTSELRVNVIKDKISTVNRSTGRRISNIEKKYEEVKPVAEDEYVTLDIHPFSLNYMYTYKNGKQVRTDAYNKWIADFPWWQVPSAKDWGVDLDKKIELSILFTAKKGFDSDNVIKSLQDMLFNRVMQMDDYNVKIGTVDRIGTVNSFADGKIKIHIRNI